MTFRQKDPNDLITPAEDGSMSPASELAGANETRGCRALWAGNEKTPTREGEGWGEMRFRGLIQPPCDGVLPLLPLRWGLCLCERQASNSAT